MTFEELWVVAGNKPVCWTIPFWLSASPGETEVVIYYAVALLPNQKRAVDGVLGQLARPYNGMWRITRPDLERIGYPVTPPIEPENYLTWERPKEYQKPHTKYDPEKNRDFHDFVDGVYQRGVGKSRDEAAFWWSQFRNQMIEWILVKERPVDLGFVKLHPSYYRRNWMLVLMGRFPLFGKATAQMRDPQLEYMFHKSGLSEAMMSMDLLAMKPKGCYCYRTIELEYHKHWFKSVETVEKSKLVRLGPYQYAQHVLNSIRGTLKRNFRLYRQWLAAIGRPCAQDDASHLPSLFRMVPRSFYRVFNSLRSPGLLRPVVLNKLPPFTQSSDKKDVFDEDAALPALPDIQCDPEKLREYQRAIRKQTDWEI